MNVHGATSGINRKASFKFLHAASIPIVILCCGLSALRAHAETAPAPSSVIASSRVYDVLPVASRGESEISLDGQWDLAEATGTLDTKPLAIDSLPWKAVQMPATIQYALFKAGAAENPWYGENWKKLQWVQDKDWYLRRRFQIPASWKGRHIRLRFDGIDYSGAVWLDGKLLGVHDGMFGGPTFDVSDAAAPGQQHELVVRLLHEAPREMTQSVAPQHNLSVMKSWAIDGRSYVWGNRFRSIGLWRSIRLVSSGQAYMEAPWVRTDHLDSNSASLWAQTMILNTGAPFEGKLRAKIVDTVSGAVAWQQDTAQTVPSGTSYWERSITLRNPKLWWPVGMGDQHLYRLQLSLLNGAAIEDSISPRFGVRTLEMKRNPYLPAKPRGNPGLPSWLTDQTKLADRHTDHLWHRADLWQSDNLLEEDAEYNNDAGSRYLFVVNGRPFYADGVNWLTSDELLTLSPQRESWMVKAARLAGINLFRLNGGVDVFETEQFFNLCDEAGILVWQELPLNWSHDSGIPLTTWREQIKQSVLRLRQHPSMAVYVGGNEFNPYLEAMAPYLGIGREIIDDYDDRPFRMASPMGSDYHAYAAYAADEVGFGDLWNSDPNWYARYYPETANFISEWSFAVFPDISTLKRVAPPGEFDNKLIGFDMDKYLVGHPNIQGHLAEPGDTPPSQSKSSIYGDMSKINLDKYAEYTQMAQADIFGYVFEQWRAQFPYKGGQTVWTYNQLSPSSGWNMIDWFGQPQISYYTAKRADEPVHVMADTNFMTWGPGSTFHASVFAVNAGAAPVNAARVTARILDRAMNPVLSEHWQLAVPAGGIKSSAHELSWRIPDTTPESYFFLEVTMTAADGHRLSRRAYWLRVLKSLADPVTLAKWQARASAEPMSTTGPWLEPQLAAQHTAVSARVLTSKVEGPELRLTAVVKNTGSKPAYPIVLKVDPDTYSVLWSDNYFWLAPGESVVIEGSVRLDMTGLDQVTNPTVANPSQLKLSASAWNADAVQMVLPQKAAVPVH